MAQIQTGKPPLPSSAKLQSGKKAPPSNSGQLQKSPPKRAPKGGNSKMAAAMAKRAKKFPTKPNC